MVLFKHWKVKSIRIHIFKPRASSETTNLLLHSFVNNLIFRVPVEDADGQRSENAAICLGVQSKDCCFTARAKLKSFGLVIFGL